MKDGEKPAKEVVSKSKQEAVRRKNEEEEAEQVRFHSFIAPIRNRKRFEEEAGNVRHLHFSGTKIHPKMDAERRRHSPRTI